MSHPRPGTIRALATVVALPRGAGGLLRVDREREHGTRGPGRDVLGRHRRAVGRELRCTLGIGRAFRSGTALGVRGRCRADGRTDGSGPLHAGHPGRGVGLDWLDCRSAQGHHDGGQRQAVQASAMEAAGFTVIVAESPDAATAKQQEPAFKAQLEQFAAEAGITDAKLSELPNFEPGVDAAVISGSVSGAGQKISAISFFALKGAVLVALSDVAIGGSIPTSEAMQTQGKATLARLP